MNDRFNPLEKRVIAAAVIAAAVHLALVAYSAIGLGISIPECITDIKPFSKPDFIDHGGKRFEVQAVARMWSFDPPVLRLPTGARVDFFVSSADVVHGFHIDRTNVNLMAVPGVVNSASAVFHKPGRYDIVCHEYCGVGHQSMHAYIEVADDIEGGFAEGVSIGSTVPAQSPETPAVDLTLLTSKGCIACHTTDGRAGVGPTLKGLFGTRVELSDGQTVDADELYIKESILEPGKKLVKGYPPAMPVLPLTDDELAELVQLIKTLK